MARVKRYLDIQVIPYTAWGKNCRSILSQEEWDVLRRKTYRMAYYRCQICRYQGRIECDEIWHIRDSVVTLVGLQSLCSDCHRARHYLRSSVVYGRGVALDLQQRLMYINDWTEIQCYTKINEAFATFNFLNHLGIEYSVDITLAYQLLECSGVSKKQDRLWKSINYSLCSL